MIDDPAFVPFIGTAFLGLAMIALFYLPRPSEERGFLLPVATASFLIKVALVPAYYYAIIWWGGDGFAYKDSYNYHLDGMEVSSEFQNGFTYTSRAWKAVDPGYPLLTGFVYWLVGPNTLVIRVLNCLISSFTLLYVYRVARHFYSNDDAGEVRIARIAALLVAFLPYSITFTLNQRKEAIVALLSTFVFLHAAKTIRLDRSWPLSAICIVVALIGFFYFRSGFVLPFLGILFICYIATTQSLIRSAVLAVPMVLLLFGVEFLVSDATTISLEQSTARLQAKIEGSADLAEVGGLVRFARMTSLFEIYKLPLATFLVAIMPYPPYFSGDLPPIIQSWANLLNLIFFPHMIRGAWAVLSEPDRQKKLPLLIFPLVFLILIGAAHVGVVRYRETIFPILLILAAIGIHRGSHFLLNAVVYGGLILLGMIAYYARFA